jgi:hypothetical protein
MQNFPPQLTLDLTRCWGQATASESDDTDEPQLVVQGRGGHPAVDVRPHGRATQDVAAEPHPDPFVEVFEELCHVALRRNSCPNPG